MGRGREGKIYLIKNIISGDDDVVGGETKTSVAFVISGVSKKNTSDGHGCQFMSCFGIEICIAGTTELVHVLI
jgi:hypothetical protein